jgi:O-antigen/teichoic acid export membrane protein
MAPWRSSLHAESSLLLGANVVNAAFGFLFWTAAARLYRPEDVGLAAAAVSAVGLLAMLSGLGLDYALVRFLPGAERPQEIINSCLTIGSVIALLLAAAFLGGLGFWSPAMMPVRTNPVYTASLVVAAIATTVVGFMAAVYLSKKNARLVLGQSLVFGTGKVVAVIIFAVAGVGAAGLLGAWVIGLVAAVIVGLWFFLPHGESTSFRFRPVVVPEVVNHMTHFASTNYLSAVLWSAPGSLLPILITNAAGVEANAYYYVASSVSGLLAMVPIAASMSLFAHGSRDATDLIGSAIQSARFSLVLLAPAILGIFLIGGKVLLIFGQAYSDAGTTLLRILALSTLPLALNFLYFGVRRVQQRMSGVVAGAVWVLVVTLGLTIILLPRVGLLGAGIAWFAAQASLAAVILGRLLLSRLLLSR